MSAREIIFKLPQQRILCFFTCVGLREGNAPENLLDYCTTQKPRVETDSAVSMSCHQMQSDNVDAQPLSSKVFNSTRNHFLAQSHSKIPQQSMHVLSKLP